MDKLILWLEGKKTIISAVATAIWGVLYQQGAIDQKTFQEGVVIGGCLMAVFMRIALAKQGQPGITVLHPENIKPTTDNLIQPKSGDV